eukprot:14801454-Ditylum_brightwellii.AAC.1
MMDGGSHIFLNKFIIDDDAVTMKAIQRKDSGGLLSNDSYVKSKLVDLNHHTRYFGDCVYEMRYAPQKLLRANHE